MSRAFVKENSEVQEHIARRRSASGLPPGAINYMTAKGAARLQADAVKLRNSGDTASAIEIERILASATVVDPPEEEPESVTLGATVTVQTANGEVREYEIVGVDEVQAGEVSWVSPIGMALLGAEVGDRVKLGANGETVTILKMEHR